MHNTKKPVGLDDVPTSVPLDFSDYLSSTRAHMKRYAQCERKYLLGQVGDRLGHIAAHAAPYLLVFPLAVIALFLLIFAGAKAWGQYLHNEAQGYLYTGLVCFGVVVLVLLLRKAIGRPVHAAVLAGIDNDRANFTSLSPERYLRTKRDERDQAEEELIEHLRALKSAEFRGTILKDAAYDALRSTKPFKYVAGLFASWDR